MNKKVLDSLKPELEKCKNDIVYFSRKYCKVEHPTKGIIPFDLYEFQEKSLIDIMKNDRNIILKARQMGISTLIAMRCIHMMLFDRNKNILVIAISEDVAKNLIMKVKLMYDNLPPFFKMMIPKKEDNKTSLVLKNGSRIKAKGSSPSAGRSEALSLLVIDECAFISDIEEIWTSAQATLSRGGSAILLSTPNGSSNLFHRIWMDAESGKNGFNFIKLPWYLHPDQDQAFRDRQTLELGEKKAAQEFDCDFASSGNSLIEQHILDAYKEVCKDPIETRYNNDFWIWEEANNKKNYIVSADVARGDGLDYSTMQILDVDNLKQVAEYKGQVDTKVFSNRLVSVSREYNNATLVIENNSLGWGVIQDVIDSGYNNLYYSKGSVNVIDDPFKSYKYDYTYTKDGMKPGFSMSHVTRELVIDKLALYFRNTDENGLYTTTPIINSVRLINELYSFIWDGKKTQAAKGYNDDLVIAMAIALYSRDFAVRVRGGGSDYKISMLNNFKSIRKTSYMEDEDPWKVKVGNNELFDLRSLL